jgi:lipopolysaccharide transport system permease protein
VVSGQERRTKNKEQRTKNRQSPRFSFPDFSFSSMPQVSNPPPSADEHWDLIIKPKDKWLDLHLDDLWRYRDLLWMFVRRDFVSVYKQTILGPIWFFIQPLFTTLVFTLVFSGMAQIPTGGQPPMLFYLAGTTAWNYFAACLTKTSTTFTANAGIFGKVYFPRLITPLSVVVSNLIQFVIQFALFLGFFAYYLLSGSTIQPDWPSILVLTPLLLLIMGLLGLGCGIIVSSLTTKYRDMQFLVGFGIQLLMYGTPVIYGLASIPTKYRPWVEANPMTPVIECFRGIYLGAGDWSAMTLLYAGAFTLITLFLGLLIFHRVEKTFMDTV